MQVMDFTRKYFKKYSVLLNVEVANSHGVAHYKCIALAKFCWLQFTNDPH